MRRGIRTAFAGVACAVIAGLALPAQAQTANGGQGMPLGGFRLYPTVTFGANYDDNIYRTQTATVSDYYFNENPAFTLQSQWGRHSLALFGALNAYQYSKRSTENHLDWNIGGDGRLDMLRGMDFTGGGSYAVQHEARTSANQPNFAKNPTKYAMTNANAAFEYHPYHFGFKLGGTYVHYNYDPTDLIGGLVLSNTDRNRDEYGAYAKGSYEFSPGYAMFVQGNYRNVHYDQKFDRSGQQRSNHGYSVNAGLDMAITRLIQGQIFVGYLDETYKGTLPNISGFNFGANVDWYPTPLLAFHLTASRTLNGTTVAGASAQDDQAVRLAADYKFRRTVTLGAYVGYRDSNFNGSARHDKYTDAGANVTYDMNPYIGIQARYDYETRNSSLAGQNFDDNVVAIRLILRR